jgi:uncharacterized membrane protein YkoI
MTAKPLCRLFAASISLGFVVAALASEPTAFDLIKEGNKYIGEQSKDRVVQIRSEKSVGGLTPKEWAVVYHDETATLKAVEVKFVGGKMASVKRPARLLEAMSDRNEPLDRKKLKIDSDKASAIVLKEPILEGLQVTAISLRLDHSKDGAVWKVRVWAQKTKDAKREADLGEIFVDAETGKVTKLDIQLNRAD